jgi:preprotein translocase subunit SecD
VELSSAEHTRANQGKLPDDRARQAGHLQPDDQRRHRRDQGTITGNFTLEEAQQLATQLRFGSLPVPLRIESTRQVGATLGEQSIDASIRAGIIGVIMSFCCSCSSTIACRACWPISL